jgi:hypothetical protein
MSNPAGTWNVTVSTPFGPQQLTIDLVVDGEKVSGTATHESGTFPFEGGTYAKDEVTFEVTLTQPVSADLTVTLKADGDRITGTARSGLFRFQAEGTRAAA